MPTVTALLQHPLWGTSELGSEAQAWLPMNAIALVFAFTGVSLSAARLLRIAVGALTILMAWAAGRHGMDHGHCRAGMPHYESGTRTSGAVIHSAYHVVEAFAARHTLPFALIQHPGDIDGARSWRSGEGDFVLVDLNTLIDRGFPLRPVHTIWRGRGRYRMPVVHIYSQPTPSYQGN